VTDTTYQRTISNKIEECDTLKQGFIIFQFSLSTIQISIHKLYWANQVFPKTIPFFWRNTLFLY